MSSALSSVRTRRTQQHPPVTAIASGKGQMTPPPVQSQNSNQSSNQQSISPTHLTLPQILEIFGKRLNALEASKPPPQVARGNDEKMLVELKKTNEETTKEWNERFELIAQELADLKDIVLRLQDYTMSVNKVLYDNANPVAEKEITTHVNMSTFDYSPSDFYEEEDDDGDEEDV